MKDDDVYQKDKNILVRSVGDELILLPIKSDASELGNIFHLDQVVSTEIFNLIDGKNTVGSIMETLLKRYSVDKKRLKSELEKFFLDLEKSGIIRNCSG